MLSASLTNKWHVKSFGSMGARLLTPHQKLIRLVMSEANLTRSEADPDRFVKRFLAQDECWVHHFEPETKRQSM